MNPLLKLVLMAAVIFICSRAGAQVSIDNAMLSGVKIEPDTSLFIFDSETQTITGYNGLVNGHLIVPQRIAGVQVLHIGAAAFYSKGVTSIQLPDGLLTLGAYFVGGSIYPFAQSEIVIPSTVTTIANNAFYNAELTKITIGANVTLDIWSFGNNGVVFRDDYNAGGKLAGTYNFDGENWTKE